MSTNTNLIEEAWHPRKLRNFFLITGMGYTYWLCYATITPILTLYIIKLGATLYQLGLVMALLYGTSLITRIPLGRLSDRFGGWSAILAVLMVRSAALLLYSAAFNWLWIAPARIIDALSFATVTPAANAIVSILAPPNKRGEAIGGYQTCESLASISGSLLCSLLTLYLTYREMLLLAAFIPFAGVGLYFLRHPFNEDKKNLHNEKNTQHSGLRKTIHDLLKRRKVAIACVAIFIAVIPIMIFSTLFAVYAQETLLLHPAMISVLFTARFIGDLIIRVPIGKVMDKIGRTIPMTVGSIVTFLSLFSISLTDNLLFLGLFLVSFGIGFGIIAVASTLLLFDDVEPKDRGVAMALMMTLFDIAAGAGSMIAGAAASIIEISTVFKLASLSLLVILPFITMAGKS